MVKPLVLKDRDVEFFPSQRTEESSDEVENLVVSGNDMDNSKEALEERIKVYALKWIETGNKAEAYRSAGYKYGNEAYKFHRKHQVEIDKHVWNAGFKDKVPTALSTLMNVMTESRNDSARVKAAIELLDRAGYNKETRLTVTNEDTKKLEEQEINKQIKQLLEQAGGVVLLKGDTE